jgi:HlyD family secretion protein
MSRSYARRSVVKRELPRTAGTETVKRSPLLLVALLLAGCEVQPTDGPVTFTAQQGLFVHEVAARGTVFSPGGTEIKCEVDGITPEGTMILEIVPEGTSVQPGDPLVQLDTSALKDNFLQQQILCNSLEAEVIAVASEREKAQLALEEYVDGLYPEEKKAAKDNLFAAETKLDQAKRILEAADDSANTPEGPAEDVDALRFNVEMAKRDVDAAKTRITVLDDFTKPRQLKQLEGEVKSAEAMMRARDIEYSLHKDRLAKIEKRIAVCTIAAPTSGVVFYANVPGETEEDQILIGEGVAVRNRQVILRIAQMDQLSVRIEVAESYIAQIRIDMPATVYVDSMLSMPFDGHVSKVHPYPTRQTRGNTSKKKYEVHVAIDNPSGNLRPGLTGEVVLTLSEIRDAIQVPATSIFDEDNASHCLVRNRNRWTIRPVVLGPTDDKMTVIHEGIEPGEDIAIHPQQHRHQAVQ